MYRYSHPASKKVTVLVILLVMILLLLVWLIGNRWADGNATKVQAPSQTTPASTKPAFDKKQHSLTDPASIWVIVNKGLPLEPATYTPELTTPDIPLRLKGDAEEMKLNPVAARALERMVKAADDEGLQLMLASGYRSYMTQKNLYNRYVQQQGQATADTQSARPGHSEHQTGLGLDLEPVSRKCEIQTCFADTPEGKWLAAHAHTYGFIIRYPKDKQSVTGYIYEPWHLRYVGPELAGEMNRTNTATLEEFFGLPSAPDYDTTQTCPQGTQSDSYQCG